MQTTKVAIGGLLPLAFLENGLRKEKAVCGDVRSESSRRRALLSWLLAT